MGTTYSLAADAFRAFIIDGVPSSGPNDPDPVQIAAVFADADTRLGILEAAQKGGISLVKATYAGLAAIPGTTTGQRAEVLNDTGTHTDPISNASVPNAGIYSWVPVPAGWQWVGAGGLTGKADLASPSFTGAPSGPTPAFGTNTAQVATTRFVQTAINPIALNITRLSDSISAKASQTDVDTLKTGKANQSDLDATQTKLAEGLQRSSSLFPEDRPGDGVAYFTPSSSTADPPDMVPLDASNIATITEGKAYRMIGESRVVSREYLPVEPGRFYGARIAFSRSVNAADPSGDTVRFGLIQYGANRQPITDLVLRDFSGVTTGSGRVGTTCRVTRTSPPGDGNIGLNAATRYVRLFVQVFGGAQQTDIQVIRWNDATDGQAYAPPVQVLQDAINALQTRLDAIAGGGPYIGTINGKSGTNVTLTALDIGAEVFTNKDIPSGYGGIDDRGVLNSKSITSVNGQTEGDVVIPVFRKIRDEAQEEFLAPYIKKTDGPLPGLRNIGHRCSVLTEASTAYVEVRGRMGMLMRQDVNGLQVRVGNFRTNSVGGIVKDATLGDATFALGLELQPQGVFIPLLWGSAASLAMKAADASAIYTTDFLAQSIPKGTMAYFRVRRLSPTDTPTVPYAKLPGVRNSDFGDAFDWAPAASIRGDNTLGGDYAAPTTGGSSNAANYFPLLSVLTQTQEPSVLLIGGGNAAGMGETIANPSGATGMLRWVANQLGFINAAVPSDRALWLANDTGGSPYARYRRQLATDVSHVVIAVGGSDLTNGATAEDTRDNVVALAAKLKSINPLLKIYIGTLVPHVLADDTTVTPNTHNAGPATTNAARIAFNTYVRPYENILLGDGTRSQAGLFAGVLDFADIMEAATSGGPYARNGGVFKDPTWVGPDGSTIAPAGYGAIQSSLLTPSLFKRFGA